MAKSRKDKEQVRQLNEMNNRILYVERFLAKNLNHDYCETYKEAPGLVFIWDHETKRVMTGELVSTSDEGLIDFKDREFVMEHPQGFKALIMPGIFSFAMDCLRQHIAEQCDEPFVNDINDPTCHFCGTRSAGDNEVLFYDSCCGEEGQERDAGYFCDDCVERGEDMEG